MTDKEVYALVLNWIFIYITAYLVAYRREIENWWHKKTLKKASLIKQDIGKEIDDLILKSKQLEDKTTELFNWFTDYQAKEIENKFKTK